MNTHAILYHLKEASEELNSTIHAIETCTTIEEEEFQVAVSHVYHHLNTAWNGRNHSAEEHEKCSEAIFRRWRKFPKEEDVLLI